MATVDFSNAQIEWVRGRNGDINPSIGNVGILSNLMDSNSTFTAGTTSTTSIVTGLVKTRYDIDNTHGYVIYTGTFTASGTEMIWRNQNVATVDYAYFRISNISFSAGDVFSFKVDVNYTFNS